jgi:hypothetical protein
MLAFSSLLGQARAPSARAVAYKKCINESESPRTLYRALNYSRTVQLGESCYAHSATRIWEHESGPRANGRAAEYVPECLAMLFALSKWPLSQAALDELIAKSRSGLPYDQGRDDLMGLWLARQERLPTKADCDLNDVKALGAEIRRLARAGRPKARITETLGRFRQQHRGTALSVARPLTEARVHMWNTTFYPTDPDRSNCRAQRKALNHYACAGVPVSINFLSSRGYLVTDGRMNGQSRTPEIEPTNHSAIVHGVWKIGIEGVPESVFATQDSVGAQGLSPEDRLIGFLRTGETCRVMRITALLNQDDKNFLREVEGIFNRPPGLSERVDLNAPSDQNVDH